MCGIAGFTGMLEARREIISRMMDRIVHRGPDMSGDYLGDGITLGFRRLSIIDLSEAGRQPMTSEDGRYTVIFNGEIYNYREIKAQLAFRGHTFHSESDTEVLLHAYMEYGRGMLDHLRGMFSFAVWDDAEHSLFCARDYFGIKPFYYYPMPDGGLIFGSEIKSFLEHPDFDKRLNPRSLRPYLTFQYSSEDETFFEGVYKLPPAHWLFWKDGKLETGRYWETDFVPDRTKSLDEWIELVDGAVCESVSAHRIADVKVGAFLSGGVDSSYITAAMRPELTFSVGYEYEKFDETCYARELSELLGIRNISRTLTAEECMDSLPTIQYHMDEPQSNPSSVPLYFLAQLAREHVTVVLSGEGSDEIFAGYDWYRDTPQMQKYKRLPRGLRIAAAAAARHLPYFKGHDFIIRSSGRPEDYFIGQAMVYSEREAPSYLASDYRIGRTPREITADIYKNVASADELTKKQYLDMKLWLPGDILLKADKMSMAHSLELRVPFLDRRVMELAERIPAGYRIKDGITKYVLRQAANRTIPDDWANRPKVGFPVPIRYWFRDERYYKYARDYFTSPEARRFFDSEALVRLLDEHKQGSANNGRKIWTALVFLIWYEQFFLRG